MTNKTSVLELLHEPDSIVMGFMSGYTMGFAVFVSRYLLRLIHELKPGLVVKELCGQELNDAWCIPATGNYALQGGSMKAYQRCCPESQSDFNKAFSFDTPRDINAKKMYDYVVNAFEAAINSVEEKEADTTMSESEITDALIEIAKDPKKSIFLEDAGAYVKDSVVEAFPDDSSELGFVGEELRYDWGYRGSPRPRYRTRSRPITSQPEITTSKKLRKHFVDVVESSYDLTTLDKALLYLIKHPKAIGSTDDGKEAKITCKALRVLSRLIESHEKQVQFGGEVLYADWGYYYFDKSRSSSDDMDFSVKSPQEQFVDALVESFT